MGVPCGTGTAHRQAAGSGTCSLALPPTQGMDGCLRCCTIVRLMQRLPCGAPRPQPAGGSARRRMGRQKRRRPRLRKVRTHMSPVCPLLFAAGRSCSPHRLTVPLCPPSFVPPQRTPCAGCGWTPRASCCATSACCRWGWPAPVRCVDASRSPALLTQPSQHAAFLSPSCNLSLLCPVSAPQPERMLAAQLLHSRDVVAQAEAVQVRPGRQSAACYLA